MTLNELIDKLNSIKAVHGGDMAVITKQVEVEAPDCECRHYTGGENRTVNVDVEFAEAGIDPKCHQIKVVLR